MWTDDEWIRTTPHKQVALLALEKAKRSRATSGISSDTPSPTINLTTSHAMVQWVMCSEIRAYSAEKTKQSSGGSCQVRQQQHTLGYGSHGDDGSTNKNNANKQQQQQPPTSNLPSPRFRITCPTAKTPIFPPKLHPPST